MSIPGEPSSIVLVLELVLDFILKVGLLQRSLEDFIFRLRQRFCSNVRPRTSSRTRTIERILDPSASARLRIGFKRGSVQERNPAKGKAVRELRQRRAYYRCCIPALAGFVSRRSIAPDGSIPMDQLEREGQRLSCGMPARLCLGRNLELGAWAWSLGLSVLGFGFSVVGRLKTVFARWLTQTQNLKH